MIGTIDTSWSSIRIALILVLFFTWIYIFFHPPQDEE